jgi:hypothetical protein
MSNLKFFKIYLIIYFLFPICTLYFALITGIKIPTLIEVVPLVLCFLIPTYFRGFRASDLLFFILILNTFFFIILNFGNYSWINNIEIRSIMIIGVNYFIFRNMLNPEWAKKITELIIKILKFSMYLIVIEFIAINTNESYEIIENKYLNVFQGSERLYEFTLFGIKSIGLYPGSHNASVASTILILYIVLTNSIFENKKLFIISLVAFIVSFSITSLIVLLLVYSIFKIYMQKERGNFLRSYLFSFPPFGLTILILINNDIVSQFKAHGALFHTLEPAGINVYINSIVVALESLIQHPMGTPFEQVDLFENEVYMSRLVMYFGVTIIFFFLYSVIILIKNLKYQEKPGVFLFISYTCLFISSFHYGSIIYYPLNILVPLTFVLFKYSKKL